MHFFFLDQVPWPPFTSPSLLRKWLIKLDFFDFNLNWSVQCHITQGQPALCVASVLRRPVPRPSPLPLPPFCCVRFLAARPELLFLLALEQGCDPSYPVTTPPDGDYRPRLHQHRRKKYTAAAAGKNNYMSHSAVEKGKSYIHCLLATLLFCRWQQTSAGRYFLPLAIKRSEH
jgi:hypothetical protein